MAGATDGGFDGNWALGYLNLLGLLADRRLWYAASR